MKKFETPELNIQKFEIVDVITTSGELDEDMTDKG